MKPKARYVINDEQFYYTFYFFTVDGIRYKGEATVTTKKPKFIYRAKASHLCDYFVTDSIDRLSYLNYPYEYRVYTRTGEVLDDCDVYEEVVEDSIQ